MFGGGFLNGKGKMQFVLVLQGISHFSASSRLQHWEFYYYYLLGMSFVKLYQVNDALINIYFSLWRWI